MVDIFADVTNLGVFSGSPVSVPAEEVKRNSAYILGDGDVGETVYLQGPGDITVQLPDSASGILGDLLRVVYAGLDGESTVTFNVGVTSGDKISFGGDGFDSLVSPKASNRKGDAITVNALRSGGWDVMDVVGFWEGV